MNCVNPEIGMSIGLYEFGLLKGERLQQFESHVQRCEHCREDLFRMQPVLAFLREHPDIITNPERYLEQRGKLLQMLASKQAIAGATVAVAFAFGITMHRSNNLARLGYVEPELVQSQQRAAVTATPAPYVAAYQDALSSLLASERRLAGFVRVDQRKLAYATGRFEEVARIAAAAGDKTRVAQCYLYLAKAALLREDPGRARRYLENVVSIHESTSQLAQLKSNARALLEQLPAPKTN